MLGYSDLVFEAQASLELFLLLLQFPEDWDSRGATTTPSFFNVSAGGTFSNPSSGIPDPVALG